jgi:secreted trypsin-like serine protease
MRKVLVAVALTVIATLTIGPAQAIVYGQLDGNLHPNVGAFVIPREDGTFRKICSGTLIDDDVFLTAAHCSVAAVSQPGVDADDVFVTFDSTFSQSSTLYPGTTYWDERFGTGGESDSHDIAVIVLDDPVAIEPADLPAEGLLSDLNAQHDLRDAVFTAVGYGTVRETRKEGPQGILANQDRRYALQGMLSLTNAWFTLAMNEATGNGGTCFGDSGGPHFLGGESSNLVVSITVTGDAVCKATDKTYRLDTEPAREFLSQFVALP